MNDWSNRELAVQEAAEILRVAGATTRATVVEEAANDLRLYRAQRDAMRTLLERLMNDEVAHPKRAIRTWLDRCDDWATGSLPIGENLP